MSYIGGTMFFGSFSQKKELPGGGYGLPLKASFQLKRDIELLASISCNGHFKEVLLRLIKLILEISLS